MVIKTPLNVIPALITVLGLLVLIFGVIGILRAQNSTIAIPPAQSSSTALQQQSKTSPQPPFSADLTKPVDLLRERLTAISQQASQVQGLLSIVLAAAGLLTLLQGIFAFFSAQNYVKQADEAIKKANEAATTADANMKALAGEILAKFPMFANVESARSEAFTKLSKLTLGFDLSDENLYESSEPLTRQEIFAIESFSAIQFLTGESRNKDLIRNLQLLGRFYGGKYLSDGDRALPSDFDRAFYYFELALQKSSRCYFVLNDLGWLLALVAKPKQLEAAKSCFRESAKANPDQQRAFYNLGTIALSTRDLPQALSDFQSAKQQSKWEETTNSPRTAHLNYNIACVYSLLSRETRDTSKEREYLEECCKHLEVAAPLGKQSMKLLEADFKPDGDLAALAQNKDFAYRLTAILEAYKLAWNTSNL